MCNRSVSVCAVLKPNPVICKHAAVSASDSSMVPGASFAAMVPGASFAAMVPGAACAANAPKRGLVVFIEIYDFENFENIEIFGDIRHN